MKAIGLLGGSKSAVVHFQFAGKEWSGIQVKSTRKGEVSMQEASRFYGCVGALDVERTLINPDDSVQPISRKRGAA